ncbi:hypothetical protein F5B22DRAFT_607532 [Xylaria bambusicola]|uniref:uncharacterized protein n=1 Tax=Xylaria bambusicola TaxID=326684 RepID=UPI002008248F|nr:uncharacterized protein F5B22DRAFT_607532 [Xylaria bambusicola]KAI0515200.1 hypothetical protein F5B22DRAFT_607532 [Xylaria bambusicola]
MSDSDGEPRSKRSRFKSFLKEELSKGLSKSKEEFTKGKLHAQHALGLGHQPNVIPPAHPGLVAESRTVAIGWHPVPGGGWLAETGLGQLISKKINNYPDPTQHWAILVGEYCHQLWMDENLDIIYINGEQAGTEWTRYEVGKTKLNDEALRQAGEMVIYNMREKQKGYNLITNNCQNFALNMLDAIQIGKHREFGTALAIFQKATGKGSVSDLFLEKLPEAEEQDEQSPDQVVQHASQVMDEHTTKIDTHQSRH